MVDLSLVLKMGAIVKKCVVRVFNTPEQCIIKDFTSFAWSYEYEGLISSMIHTIVVRKDK